MADGGPQQIVGGGYTQRSLSAPKLPLASRPSPPKSQRLPLLSVQLVASSRPPGMFVLAGDCSVPYTPDRKGVPLPPIHTHWLVGGLNAQRSLSVPVLVAPSPPPPKSQKLPLLSIQLEAS